MKRTTKKSASKKTAKRKATKKVARKRRNPESRDLELITLMKSIGEPSGFSIWISSDAKIFQVIPWIPESPEWEKDYPTLVFYPFDLNKTYPSDKVYGRVANILGWEKGKEKDLDFLSSRSREAKMYLARLNEKRYKSLYADQALQYLSMYHKLKSLPGVEKRSYY